MNKIKIIVLRYFFSRRTQRRKNVRILLCEDFQKIISLLSATKFLTPLVYIAEKFSLFIDCRVNIDLQKHSNCAHHQLIVNKPEKNKRNQLKMPKEKKSSKHESDSENSSSGSSSSSSDEKQKESKNQSTSKREPSDKNDKPAQSIWDSPKHQAQSSSSGRNEEKKRERKRWIAI